MRRSTSNNNMNSSSSRNSRSPPAPRGEDALLLRARAFQDTVLARDDAIEVKAELLFLLATLVREASATNASHTNVGSALLLDIVRGIRTMHDVRLALIKTEKRLPHHAAQRRWKIDRHAWLLGAKIASSPGEFICLLSVLREHIQVMAWETRPDMLVSQIKAAVNDLEAFGDEGLLWAYDGECRDVCLALLRRGTDLIAFPHNVGLQLATARVLLEASHVQRAMQILDLIAESPHHEVIKQPDIELAKQLRESAAKKKEVDVVVGDVTPTAAVTAPPNDAQQQTHHQFDTTLATLQTAFSNTTTNSKTDPWTVSFHTLDRVLESSVLRHHVLTPVLGNGAPKLGALYTVDNSSSSPTDSGEHRQKPSTHHRFDSPEWRDFDRIVDRALKSLSKTHDTVVQCSGLDDIPPVVDSLMPAPSTLFEPLLSVFPKDLPHAESRIVSLRNAAISSFAHSEVFTGWVLDSVSGDDDDDTALASENDEEQNITITTTPPALLFEDVWFIPHAPPSTTLTTSDMQYSKGIFVSEACAKICHHGVNGAVHVGRLPITGAQCGKDCLMALPHHNVWSTTLTIRRNAEEIEMMKDETHLPQMDQCVKLFPLLLSCFKHMDDETAHLKRFVQAWEDRTNAQTALMRIDRLKWGFDQIKTILSNMLAMHRAAARRFPQSLANAIVEFASRAVSMHQGISSCGLSGLFTSACGGVAEVETALVSLYNLMQEKSSLTFTLTEARRVLNEEEQQLQRMPVTFLTTEDGDEISKLSAVVLSRSNHVAYLETRIQEMHAIIVNQAAAMCVKYEATLREGAVVVYALCKRHDDELPDVPSSGAPQDVMMSTQSAICGLDSMLGKLDLSEHGLGTIRTLAQSARRVLEVHIGDELHTVFHNEVNSELTRMDVCATELRNFTGKWFNENVAQRGYSRSHNYTTNPLSYVTSALQEVTSTVARLKVEFGEAVAIQTWRKSEFLWCLHVRNQLLMGAITTGLVSELLNAEEERRCAEAAARLAEMLLKEEENKGGKRHHHHHHHHKKKAGLSSLPTASSSPPPPPAPQHVEETGATRKDTESPPLPSSTTGSVETEPSSVSSSSIPPVVPDEGDWTVVLPSRAVPTGSTVRTQPSKKPTKHVTTMSNTKRTRNPAAITIPHAPVTKSIARASSVSPPPPVPLAPPIIITLPEQGDDGTQDTVWPPLAVMDHGQVSPPPVPIPPTTTTNVEEEIIPPPVVVGNVTDIRFGHFDDADEEEGDEIHVTPSPPLYLSPAPPQICMFFQQGTCRYGPNCRNLHVLMPPPPPLALAPPPMFVPHQQQQYGMGFPPPPMVFQHRENTV